MNIDYSIIIPAYHAESSIEKLYDALKTYFASTQKTFEVIFVDDASSDSTWKVLQQLKQTNKNVKIVRFAKNFGQHAATLCGFSFAKGKFVITMDDDLEIHPDQISKLIEEQQKGNHDVVYGEYKKLNQPFFRGIFTKFYKFGSKMVEGKNKGKGSPFRMIKTELAHKLAETHRHFVFIDELLLWYTSNIAFIQVNPNPNYIRKGGYSLGSLFKITSNVVMFSSASPLKLVTNLGISLATINFLIGSFYLLKKTLFKAPVPGYTSIIVSLLFSTGLIVLSIGIVAQYISKIMQDVNKKPSYHISENLLTIKQYGVTLTRITSSDIELLRYWRNQQSVKMYMDYRENITPEMQLKWFESVNNKFNYYFIIEFEGKQVGLINAKNFSYENGFGEGGIFIWDADYINSFAAVFSTLALLNFVFHKVKLCKTSHARILKDNDRAIHYNQLIGYKLSAGQENEYNQLYVLTLEDYLKNGAKLNKAAEMLNNGNGELTFSGTVSENNLDEINKLLKN